MKLTALTDAIRSGAILTEIESARAVDWLLQSDVSDAIKSEFLLAQMQRGLHEDELVGFARSILPRAPQSSFIRQWKGRDILDCCGTGGGGLNLLNISTGIIFILAAAGVPVVKHGNRGVTKKSGSADVLEALGLKIDLTPDQLEDSMQQLGWGFVYAPGYHSSFKAVATVRQSLGSQGQKTVFNFLGPLLNPVRPNAQLVGVFQEKLAPLYYSTLKRLGCPKPCVVFGTHADGTALGELSISGANLVLPAKLEWKRPAESGAKLASLMVKGASESARLLERILKGEESGFASQTVIGNAALAFAVQGTAESCEEGIKLARETIDSGAAWQLLERSRGWSHDQK